MAEVNKKQKTLPSRQAGKNKKQKTNGFTLVELLVAFTIFSIIGAIASESLVSTLRVQRRVLAEQELSDQTSYLVEYMSRAIRMAKKDLTGVCIPIKTNYQKTAAGIKFLNYNNVCQEFFLENQQVKESKTGSNSIPLTSGNLKVNSFNIELSGETQTDTSQPRITLSLEISGKEQAKINIQTAISQRNLDIVR